MKEAICRIIRTWSRDRTQLLTALVVSLNSLSDGMSFGWSAPSMPILKAEKMVVTVNHALWIEIMYMIGGAISLPFLVFLNDKLGRRNILILSSVVGILGWTCIAAGEKLLHLLIGRFLLGFSADIAYEVCLVYVSEIAHHKKRGVLGGILLVTFWLGVIIVYVSIPCISVHLPAVIGGIVLYLHMITLPFIPESPYHLLYTNEIEKAAESLKRLRNGEDVSEEFEKIKSSVEREKAERRGALDLIMIRSNRKACLFILLLYSTQFFAGKSLFVMNVHEILMHAQSNFLNSHVTGIIFATLMLIASSSTIFMADKYGRKPLLISSAGLTCITLISLAVYFHLQFLDFNLKSFSWIPILSVMLHAVCFNYGLGSVSLILASELFPVNLKSWSMAFVAASYLAASTASIYIYQILSHHYGIHVPFYVFSVYTVIGMVLIITFIPETKGKTLEEIQIILKK